MRFSFSSSWLITLVLFPAIVLVSSAYGQCQSDQRVLLLLLKNSLSFGPLSSTKLVKWNQTTDCCEWNGVKCDKNGRVVGLDLSEESITGGIDNTSSLFGLQHLQTLNLSLNNFRYSQIPSEIAKLENLVHLNFSNAGFGGQIPIEFSNLTHLVTLDFSTLFTGVRSLKLENPILSLVVQNLAELRELYLDGVNISARGNEWCEALSSSLPKLTVLSMSNCYLSGPIDPSLLKLQFLTTIRLDDNNFSTSVPNFFGKFKNLVSLKLSNCGLSGRLPGKVFQLPTLQTLDLSNNTLLEGSVQDFPQNGSLQILVLSYTSFSGRLPESIGNLKWLSKIDLSGCNFTGSISSSIAKLKRLVYVDFSFNQFKGTMPSFATSKKLTQIILSNNELTGQIPSSLFSLPSLQKIQLSNNRFSAPLNLPLNMTSDKLDTLDLSRNRLQGPLSPLVFELRGLKILSLASNNFSGSVHLGWTQKLRNLSSLDLSYNKFSIVGSLGSSLPQLRTLRLASCGLQSFPHLRNQSKLTFLDLSENQIEGKVPNWIWNIGNGSLLFLNLSQNRLEGFEEPYTIPALVVLDLHNNLFDGRLPALPPSATYLDYSNNKFAFSIPDNIGKFLSFAIFVSLSNNSLNGSIPESVCLATYLRVLDFSNNMLSGKVPVCLFEISTSLGVLNLRRNNLGGSLADAFPENCALETINLNGNQIEGQIPRSLAKCSKLEVLNIGNNKINDYFPCHLKNISSLRVAVLRSNRFYGSIGCLEDGGPWPMLQIVDLASNNFGGKLPKDCLSTWKAMMGDGNATVGYLQFEFLSMSPFKYYQDALTVTTKGLELEFTKILTIYTAIDFSNNSFEGSIPDVMGDLIRLLVLNLSHNALTGPIPSALGNLQQLESLDLSSNKLSEKIPAELANLSFLAFLNLSDNQLVGEIPKRSQFPTFSEETYEGNKGLCGKPLEVTCHEANKADKAHPKSESYIKNQENGFAWQLILTGLGYGVGTGAVVAPIMFWRRASECLDNGIDKLLLLILPMVGLTYTTSDNWNKETEEDFEEDATDDSDEDTGGEDGDSYRRYCVFCSKVDITQKIVVHDAQCRCHHESSSLSSSSFRSSYSLSP